MATRDEKKTFYKAIEKIVNSTELNWIEAITHYCETTGMEIEVAASLVNEQLKRHLEEVALNTNNLKMKRSTLV
jgi:hypothetical protein